MARKRRCYYRPRSPETKEKIAAALREYHARARAGIALLEQQAGQR